MDIENVNDRIAKLSPAKRALLEMKLRQKNQTFGDRSVISRRSMAKPLPLSFAQERLWFLDQLEPDSRAYNQPKLVRLKGLLDSDALQRALNTVVMRHEVLRTTYHPGAEYPIQLIGENSSVELPTIDISELSDIAQDAKLQAVVQELSAHRFDLSNDLMLRAALFKLGPEEHALLLITHHIASDGWSSSILWREMGALYSAFSQGAPNPLPELEIQYADYSGWQREWLQGKALEQQLTYWKQQLAGLQPLEFPTDRLRPAVQTYQGAKESFKFSRLLSDELGSLSRQEGVTLYMTLLAAFQTLLYRYTGQEDVAVGSPIAGRARSEIEGLIGFFVNMLVLRSDLSGNPSFCELLGRVRKTAFGAYEYQDVPFEKLVEVLQPERDLSRSPLFQVMFAFQNVPRQGFDLPGLVVSPIDIKNETAKYDLSLYMWDEPGGLVARLEYNTDLFDRASMQRLLTNFEKLLEAIAKKPRQRISELPLISENEQHQILVEWNDTAREFQTEPFIHRLIEAQVNRTPDKVALVYKDQQLTYRELNERANQLAHYLCALGVGSETPVGICMERSWEMVVALLAILKAGGTYVPMDPSHPTARIALVLQDAAVKVLLTQSRLAEDYQNINTKIVRIDSEWNTIVRESIQNLLDTVGPENLAYLIYTSGSTGRPKGVEITHRSVVNFLNSMRETPGIRESDTFLAVTTLSFDIAGLELYLPLSVGARIVIAPPDVASDGHRLSQLIKDSSTTFMQATPATWRLLLEAGWPSERNLTILCGGEALPRAVADQLLDRSSNVWNMYGPTETTIWSALHRIGAGDIVPVGRPIHNTQLYILDRYLNPVPVSALGELYIGGAGLGRGYKGRADLTAQQFIPSPFATKPGSLLYRTGDLARYHSNGTIEILGRIDYQVKIRGFRIELGEIEAVLSQHDAIKQVVIVDRDFSGDKRLVGYVVTQQGETVSAAELKEFLRRMVPEYMIPAGFVFLDQLPLTPNGKVDRKALPDPKMSHAFGGGDEYVAPRSPIERAIAEVWQEVLGVDRISVHDNFFDLGGHSLLSLNVITKIEERVGQRIHPREMILQTLGQLAALCNEQALAPKPVASKGRLRTWFAAVTSFGKS